MDDEFDKKLNRKSNFKYPAIDAKIHVRLLRCSQVQRHQAVRYDLEIVALTDLFSITYKALSYIWGHAHKAGDIREIHIDSQPIFIRRNLFDFLNTAAAKGEYGLFFIDAICINQLDHGERQSQVQEMGRIYRNANEVIAWLGVPNTGQLDNLRALSQTKGKECVNWTTAQWAGFRCISYHRYWSRVWIVQEVLLALRMTIWCGFFTFAPELFEATLHTLPSFKTRVADDGRPMAVVSASSRLCSPAEITISHRLRQVIRPIKDNLAQGTKTGTWEEMKLDLMKASTVAETYQSRTPDLIYHIMRKFGKLECSDPRDRFYGLLGILDERSRARVEPDYTKDVSYAYYQALKVGLQELYLERGAVAFPYHHEYLDSAYLGYYCDVRDAFGMTDRESISILRQVLGELQFQTRLQDATVELQWQQQFVWRGAEINLSPDFKQLLAYGEREQPEGEGSLFRFHKRQRRMAESLLTWVQSRRNLSQRRYKLLA